MVREIDITCPVEFFARLSDYGRKKHCCLLESRDYLTEGDAGELTFGTTDPALHLTGRGNRFSIEALTPTGRRMLAYFAEHRERFAFCKSIAFAPECITGELEPNEDVMDEESRLKRVNQMDVLRAVGFAFELASKPFRVTCGLVGALSYDFIDQFEKLPDNTHDVLGNPDYELYFADNIFLMDHRKGKGHIIVNAIITNGNRDEICRQAEDCFDSYFERAASQRPVPTPPPSLSTAPGTDTPQATYEAMVKTAKQHILTAIFFRWC